MMVGDTKEAEALIQSALMGKPDDPATLRLAAGFYVDQGRTDQADPILEKLAASSTKASPEDLAWVNRTRSVAFLKTGGLAALDQALRLVELNLKADPSSINDERLRAVILALRTSRRGDAIRLLEPLDSAKLLSDEEEFLLARLYLSEGQKEMYQGEMLKLLDRGVKNPQHLAHYITFLIDRQQLDPADHWVAMLKQVEPQGLRALDLEARLLKIRKREPELLALLQARGRHVPDQIGPVADLLNHYGFAQEAEAAYKEFIARDPKQPERALALVPLLGREGRVAEAIKILSNAHATCRPEQVATYALSLYDAPSVDEDQRRQVEAWVAEACQKRPEVARLAVRLGGIWTRRGRFDEAEASFRRILASDPDNGEALNNLAWLLALRNDSRIKEALRLIEHAIEVQGPASSLVDTLAVVCIRDGQLDRAVGDLTAALVRDPGNPSLARHLAWAYQKSGRTGEAKSAFQKAVERGWKPANSSPPEWAFMDRLRKDLGFAANYTDAATRSRADTSPGR
jgi:tetratricopeptide (TPR) repeat protein